MDLIFPDPANEEAYLKYAGEVDAIVGWRPTEELISKAQKMKLFVNPGAGVRHLRDKFSKRQDVAVANSHGNAYSTAQHIVAMLLSATNKLIQHHQWMKAGKWRTGDKEGKSFQIKTLKIGLLGYGHINRQVHEFLKPFQAEVYFCKRSEDGITKEESHSFYPLERIHDFISLVDVLIVTVPHTSGSESMIGAKELELLGENGILINTGRGAVIEEEALYHALQKKQIAFAAVDVWYKYDCDENEEGKKYPYKYPFHELENILFSPHRAASPLEDLNRWSDVIFNLKQLCLNEPAYINVVDLRIGY
ncbi:MAG: hypothetical protein HKN92_02980 [Chitinophagales bacterium]|nr:hypothetical protein [Chitinophagales bacterium]